MCIEQALEAVNNIIDVKQQAEDTEETDEISLFPSGNGKLIEDVTDDTLDREFITIQSKNGNSFFIVIDRNSKKEGNVYFMNLVDEYDLLAFSEEFPENAPVEVNTDKKSDTKSDKTEDTEDTDTDSNELLETLITQPGEDETEAEETNEGGLKAEEQELARAVTNFKDGVEAMAGSKNLRMPQTDYTEDMLKPNYKPSTGKKIAQYLLDCWDIINKYDPENMKRLSPEATDEEYLSFAEGLNDTYMQLAIISYVEILINIEICEVSYEQKKELAVKNRIKRELYEEYMELQERKNLFIQKLKEKNFPIDADRLINNYFRAAQKDADGAFEALTKNPAMFAPIQFEKMRPKFFGLIKVTPEDGIKANQKIGAFIKKLKV